MQNLKSIESLEKYLRLCFKKSLPGVEAHLGIAPNHRRKDIVNAGLRKNGVRSSVLILFYEKGGDVHLVFIRRPNYAGVHSGQISFPGGRWEKTDKSLYHTALREAREEVGIYPEKVKYTGKLSDLYISPSNFLVSPFVGIYQGACVFEPDPTEVAEIVEVPFSFFLETESLTQVDITVRGTELISTPAFVFNEHIIWGATAMILNELILQWKNTIVGKR
ncbi:MAG: CoA pyrophosphatase [Bacteroidales bacterium]